MPKELLAVEQVLALLAAAPADIFAITASATPAQLRLRPAPQAWSASEVLAHLRACADVWGGAIARIIAEEQPAFRAVSPRTWIRRTDYASLDVAPSRDAFTRQRTELLTLLQPLPADGWQRRATLISAGKRSERTALAFATGLATHERQHLAQLERITAAVRGREVG